MITSAGVYRAKGFADWGISETNNGFPQFVVRLIAEEYYDPQVEKWVVGSGEDMTGYFVLFGSNGNATLNMKQVLAVTNYAGATLSGLAAADLSIVPVLFRIEPHVYEGKETLQMTWLDTYDASPIRSIKKLEGDALKTLDNKFASAFKQAQGPAKPVSAPTTSISPTESAPKKRGRSVGSGNKPVVQEKIIMTPSTQATPTTTPKAPPKAPPKVVPTSVVGSCSKDEAWATCVELRAPDTTDEETGQVWLKVIDTIAPGIEDEAITPEQWFEIKETVLKEIGIPF